MTPLDTLKAGLKTAIVTFIGATIAIVVGLLGALADWAQDGSAPDLGNVRGLAVAAALALVVGVLNTVARYVQVAGVPFLAAIVDRILGAVPAYPEPAEPKLVTPKQPRAPERYG